MNTPAEGRVLGVDLGAKRVGIAVCDASRILATPLCVIERQRSSQKVYARIAQLALEENAVAVVVGIPIDLRGVHGVAATAMREEIDALRAILHTVCSIPLFEVDERMTTAQSHTLLAESGLRSKQRRKVVDMAAATSILQGWLDRTI